MNTKQKFILHCDINKTIIVTDSSTGKGVDDSLQSLLSEVCWGELVDDSKVTQDSSNELTSLKWRSHGTNPSIDAPNESSITFGSFLENHTNLHKKQRKVLKTTFGKRNIPMLNGDTHTYTEKFEELKKYMRMGEVDNRYHFIIPSFFKLLDYLFSEEVTQNIEWKIVFRSFGDDIDDVIVEINSYLSQYHPFHTIDRQKQSGEFKRVGPTQYDLILTMKSGEVIEGVQQINTYLLNMLDSHNFFVIRDDYPWWNSNMESDHSGKLLLLQPNIKQIFIDDNIERDRAHIVDVRNLDTFEPIPFTETKDRILIKAEPYLAIIDENYFVDIVKRAFFS
jgi:hypothetical protein